MSPSKLSTDNASSLDSWRHAIATTYFEMEIESPEPRVFEGELECWESEQFGLSIVKSSPVIYRRRKESCRSGNGRLLITVPLEGEFFFSQFKRKAKCGLGSFTLEASDEPYEFTQERASKLLVFRVGESALRDRVHDVQRFFAASIDAHNGVGRLFTDFLQLSLPHIASNSEYLLPRLGPRLLDVLVTALESDPQAICSSLSSIQAAHMARIDAYIEQNFDNAELSLEEIAIACGISLRYLNQLFKDAGTTGRQWIRDRRLRTAHEFLTQPGRRRTSIASLAYSVGFSDQAQFSRAFRTKFGCSPRECVEREWPA